MNDETVRPGRYRHFKGGEYRVVTLARHSETGETMVVYRSVADPEAVWVRPAAMWNETVTRDGRTFPRFAFLGE